MGDGFQDELGRVGGALVTMVKAVREAMRQASTALLAADHGLAQQVIVRDAEIDVLHRVVDDRVFELVARRSAAAAPVAASAAGPAFGDPRAVLIVSQIAADLDRMGELAVHVARATLRRQPVPAVAPELAGLFRRMGAVADGLTGKIVAALTDRDAVPAGQLDRDDDAMDQLHRDLFTTMLSPDWPLGVEAAIDGALLGRYYERYADHAVNVGRHVVFLITGKPLG